MLPLNHNPLFQKLGKKLPERCNGGGHTGVACHWVLPVHGVVRGGVAGGAIRGGGGGQAGWDGGDAGHDRRRVHCGGRLQTAHVETHGRHATEETWVSWIYPILCSSEKKDFWMLIWKTFYLAWLCTRGVLRPQAKPLVREGLGTLAAQLL